MRDRLPYPEHCKPQTFNAWCERHGVTDEAQKQAYVAGFSDGYDEGQFQAHASPSPVADMVSPALRAQVRAVIEYEMGFFTPTGVQAARCILHKLDEKVFARAALGDST